jgi:predicted nuclease of restriction endonuclease-like (RecB) superfamily
MNFEKLIQVFEQTHEYLQNKAVSAVNQSLTVRNWLFGLYIVEYEQNGEDRAKYGKKLLKNMAQKLSSQIKGMNDRYLRDCRQFYVTYPQIAGITDKMELPEQIWRSVTPKLKMTDNSEHKSVNPVLLISRLSYTHLLELTKETEALKRAFYEIQAIKGNWSVRELERQRGSLLYERTGLSKNKEKLLQITRDEAAQLIPADIIRDPYIFEFIGLKQHEVLKEDKLEKALLDHIQQFLLELGKGFCFEYRQKRITVDGDHFSIDLVFYHRILKCHVLIDLKTRKFVHSDASQMNFYLNYFIDNEMTEGDNPPIGILLCTGKGESTVKYATAGMNNQLFISKYKTVLPTEDELRKEIEKEKRLLGE